MDVYDFAMQMAEDGEKFYRMLAGRVTKPGLRRILTMLADDQAIHRRTFQEMKGSEKKPLPKAEILEGVKNVFAQRMKRPMKVGEDLTQAELYQRGQALYRECEDFYREMASKVTSKRLKEAFLRVADEQRRHYFTLEHIITFISEPQQGLEDPEWFRAEES
jgi:rubrerythrin